MKFRWEKKYLYWGLTAFLVIVLSISFFILMYNFRSFINTLKLINAILMPFIIGFVIAYLLNPLLDFFENKCFIPLLAKTKFKGSKKFSRVLSIIVTIILALAFITGLLFMVIPQLIESINAIIKNMPTYFQNLKDWIIGLVSSNPSLKTMVTKEFDNLNQTITTWGQANIAPKINSIITGVTSGLIDVVIFLKNILIGLIISIYIMFSKEKFFAQSKKFLYALFPVKASNKIVSITRHSHKIFGGFISGILIDSLIVGILCFLGMSIIKIPYALLISVIIATTNIIPFFGPFIGAIPSALLILMIDPLRCLYFIIFILAMQQLDGNVINPKIVGNSTGLSAFWVIFAILISGGLFGFAGMVIGVPTFAVIYSLIAEFLDNRLAKRELPVKTSDYNKLEFINTTEHEPVYGDDDMKIVK